MGKSSNKGRKITLFLIAIALVLIGFLFWFFFFTPTIQPQLGRGWRTMTREGMRILGWEKGETPPEEKRIREEVILKLSLIHI